MTLTLEENASQVEVPVVPGIDALQHEDYAPWSMSLADEDRADGGTDDFGSRASFTRCCSASSSEHMWLFFRANADVVRSELWNEIR